MPRVSFNEDLCKGCGLCISVCPRKILAFSKGKLNKKGYPSVECTDQQKCAGCAMCAVMCPDVVIKVEK
ncbi:MAG: 4Fe-4S binding protein [Bacillota bacterium]|nr:4Fe-4S binding protein [Bacillota bacterium]